MGNKTKQLAEISTVTKKSEGYCTSEKMNALCIVWERQKGNTSGKKNESRLDSCVMLCIRLRFKSTVLGNPWLTYQNDHTFAGVTLACSCPEDNKEDWVTLSFSLPSACASKQFIRPKHLGLTEPEINVSVSLWHAASNHYLSDKPCHRPN